MKYSFKIAIHHDVYGDIVGLECWREGVLLAKCGYANHSVTTIEQELFCGVPMFVIYNNLKDANKLTDCLPTI